LPGDIEAKDNLLDLLVNKYIDDVNSVYSSVTLDEDSK
jgi:hypothetical protein